MAGAIAVSVGSGAIQSLGSVIDNAANNFPSPVSITLTWDLHPSTGAVQVIGYFANPDRGDDERAGCRSHRAGSRAAC